MIRSRQQQIGSGPQSWREHDPDCDQQPDYSLPASIPASIPAGCKQSHQHHQQRVGERRGYVYHAAGQPPGELHEHVLGKFSCIERHVR